MIINASFDPRKYAVLLAQTLPAVSSTEADNERMLEAVNKLMSKGEDRLAPEERKLLRLMVRLIEDFEAQAYRIEPGPPYLTLQRLMEARGVRQGLTAHLRFGRHRLRGLQRQARHQQNARQETGRLLRRAVGFAHLARLHLARAAA